MSSQSVLSEQTSLYARLEGDPFWLDRFMDDDPVARMGETFQLNAMVSPTAMRAARLIHPEARLRTGQWLRETLGPPSEQSIRRSPLDTDPIPLDQTRTTLTLGIDLTRLPEAYGSWRLGLELYALVGRHLYLLLDSHAMPYRRLSDEDLGVAMTGRLLPFADPDPDSEPRNRGDFNDAMLFLVAVPGRLGALGGLRGIRTCWVEAGTARCEVDAATAQGSHWEWHTEFFDDACARVLGIDGVERAPVLVATRKEGDRRAADVVEPAR